MHKQKLLAIFCVATLVGASVVTVRAEDNDAQAKAREALRQAMAQADASTNSSTTAPAPAAPAAVAPAVPATYTPAPSAPAVKRVGLTPEQEAEVREALRKAVADTSTQPVAPAASAPTPAPVQPTPAVSVTPAPTKPEGLSSEQEEKALEAMRAEKARLDAADAARHEAETAALAASMKNQNQAKPQGKKVSITRSSPSTTIGVAPAPSSKEQKLHDLLELYKADKITPTEYHQERAKILAE